jgi:hypothetical protein
MADSERLGSLTANRNDLTWTPTEGAPVSGRHRGARLDPTLWDQLADVFTRDGLKLGDSIVSPDQLLIQITAVSRDSIGIAFDRLYAPNEAVGLLWSPGRMVTIERDEVWFGDIVVLDAGATVNGEVIGNVIAIGGDVTVGAGATIRGDVIALGGSLRQRGDAKIYGSVFAPGGHRRPRLFVPRAGELEEEGHEIRPTVSYDRVDGFRPGIGGVIQNDNAATRAGLWAAYAFASETWQFRFDIRQKLIPSGSLEGSASIFRLTGTDDDEIVNRAENTAFAILAGSDYRDYFGADGGELGLTLRYRDVGSFSITYRNVDYRWLEANPRLWHLFRPDHDFRENFSTLGATAQAEDLLQDNSSSASFVVRIAPVESGQHPIGFNGSLVLSYEIAGGLLGGDYDYDRLTLTGLGGWDSGHWHRVTLRAVYGAARHGLPPNKLFYSGGIGTLRGYPQKVFAGDQTFVGNAEYHFVYWENPLGDAAVVLFLDLGRTTTDDNFWDPDDFYSDIGIGLDFGDTFRIDAAKGLDHTHRDIRVSIRMTRPW